MIADFPLHAADLGYRVTEPLVADGRIHRVSWSPDSRNKSGWYVAWDHGDWATVAWGDWRDCFQDIWTSRSERRLTQTDRAAVKAHMDDLRALEAAERAKSMRVAEFWADRIWKDAVLSPDNHPYLERKQITGKFLRVWERDGVPELLVPLRNEHGSLSNIQRIGPDGTKRFIRNAGVKGLHWRTGPMPPAGYSGDIPVTEGVATAATVRTITGLTTFAALNTGNLPPVAAWIRKTWPHARILIAADDDRWNRDGTPRAAEQNMGRVKAQQAAKETRALVILPVWTDLQSRGTDWNDLWCEEGEIAARSKWANALTVASLDRQVATMTDSEYASRRAGLQAAYANAGAGRLGTRQLDQRRRETQGTAAPAPGAPSERPPMMDLMDIIADYELWHDQFGVAYVTMENDGLWMNAKVESQAFDDWLRNQYHDTTANDTPLLPQTIVTMTKHAASMARTRGECYTSHFRVAKGGGYRWLDLGRKDWKCVRWNAEGWEIVDRAGVKFFRGDARIGLPLPEKTPGLNGLEPLWKIINTGPENHPLLAGFLLGALKADTPCFALVIQGQQGSAKSVATELIRKLLDPTAAPFQRINDVHPEDFGLTCVDQLIPCFDNISSIEPEMQDTLCSLTTGFGFKTRKLYTDSGVVSCWVRRPWIVNGITNVCSRSDLAERSIPVHLDVIGEGRRTEDDVREEFASVHAHLLAVLLDAAVEAEKHWELAGASLKATRSTHRMADALQWITAGEDGLGFPGGTFLARLKDLQQEAGRESLEGTAMMNTLEALLDDNSRGLWRGTSEEILAKLEDFAPARTRSKYLPNDSKTLGNWFRREGARLLNSFGIDVGEIIQVRESGSKKRIREIRRIHQLHQAEF